MTALVPSDIDGPAGEAGDLIEPEFGWRWMPTYGQMKFSQLVEAVSEATYADRAYIWPLDKIDPDRFIGHQIVPTINFNSLNRIVSAFVATEQRHTAARLAALQQENERLEAAYGKEQDAHMRLSDQHSEQLNKDAARIMASEALASSLQRRVEELTGELKRIAASDGGAERLRYMANVAIASPPEQGGTPS